jgi:hypothetical protein
MPGRRTFSDALRRAYRDTGTDAAQLGYNLRSCD